MRKKLISKRINIANYVLVSEVPRLIQAREVPLKSILKGRFLVESDGNA